MQYNARLRSCRSALLRAGVSGFLLVMMAVNAVSLPAQAPQQVPPPGVVVEEVAPGSSAAKTGLQVGDILLQVADRPLLSPTAFLAAEENLVGLPAVTMKARRGNRIFEATLASGVSGLLVRPFVSPGVLALYRAGQTQAKAKHWEAAIAQWHTAFKASEATGEKQAAIWLCSCIFIGYRNSALDAHRVANLQEARKWMASRSAHFQEARKWLERDWEFARGGNDKDDQADVLINLGMNHLNQQDPAGSAQWFEQAYPLTLSRHNEMWAAEIRDLQGLCALSQYQQTSDKVALDKAQKLIGEALSVRKRLAPHSKKMADSLNHMAWVAAIQADYEKEKQCDLAAFEIYRKTEPQSKIMIDLLQDLGNVAEKQSDLESARGWYREALGVCDRLASDDPEKAPEKVGILNNLGRVVTRLGDFRGAQAYARRALEIDVSWNPASQPERANCCVTLGLSYAAQGDLRNAQISLKQGLNICRNIAPTLDMMSAVLNSTEMGIILDSLALISFAQDRFKDADEYCKEALAIWAWVPVGGLEGTAVCMDTLGMIAASKNDRESAKQWYRKALNNWRKSPVFLPGSAVSLDGLGLVAVSNGDLASAERDYREALSILKKTAPGTLGETACLANLGRVRLLQHHPEKALPLFEEAVDALETQRQQILDLDTRALFVQQNASPYDGLMQTYLALNQPDKAFAILERAHARSLADRLAEIQEDLDTQIPAALRERRDSLNDRRRSAETALQHATQKQDKAAEKTAQQSLETMEDEQRRLETDLREAQPGAAALQYPQPVDLKMAQRTLPPGTLALAYAVDEKSVNLFSLTCSSFHYYTLPLSRMHLIQKVKEALDLIKNRNSAPSVYQSVLQRLYKELLTPVRAEIAHARSLLICPDGPLHLLPFAALMPAPGRFLIEDKPIHIVASLTVYKNLLNKKLPTNLTVLALGNTADKTVSKQKYALDTVSLAEEIGRLYGPHSIVLLGKQATIANLSAKSEQVGILNLGCHSRADNQNPFGSWLALTSGFKDNGRLYAWQVLGMKLKANLVVLAACETGLGAETRFEGVQGMARAFQAAGADNVLMTMWVVDENATCRLLRDFYLIWKRSDGKKTIADALREAQIKTMKDDSRPYLWASLVLDGVGE